MRLAVYTDAESVGGAEISLGHLIANLPGGVEVGVFGCWEPALAHLVGRRPDARTALLPFSRDPWDLGVLRRHVRALRDMAPDVVHVNLPVPWSCWHGVLAGTLTAPVTTAVEQLVIKPHRSWEAGWKRRLVRRQSAHLAVGAASARQLEAWYGLPPRSVGVVRNGVPNPGVTPVPHDGVRLVAVGRLAPVKAHESLLEVLAELPETVSLTIVGGGDREPALRAQAARLGVAARLRITGWTHQVGRHLAEADVFVLPSRSEGFPLSIVEAMFAGLPVVASDVGSVAEAVRDGETGILVPSGDIGALAAALRKLTDDEPLRRQMGARGRQAARHLTARAMAARYFTLWQDLLCRGTARS